MPAAEYFGSTRYRAEGMKLKREEWPATRRAKFDVVAQWAFFGILLGGIAYTLLWQFMEPVGQPPGGAMAMVKLVTSPWAWAFLALYALSMALIPVMAICRGTESTYRRSLHFLGRIWAGGLLVTGIIAVRVYRLALRGHELDWSIIDLFTLSIPTLLALAVLVFGCRLAER
jgi:hypothetical protein